MRGASIISSIRSASDVFWVVGPFDFALGLCCRSILRYFDALPDSDRCFLGFTRDLSVFFRPDHGFLLVIIADREEFWRSLKERVVGEDCRERLANLSPHLTCDYCYYVYIFSLH